MSAELFLISGIQSGTGGGLPLESAKLTEQGLSLVGVVRIPFDGWPLLQSVLVLFKPLVWGCGNLELHQWMSEWMTIPISFDMAKEDWLRDEAVAQKLIQTGQSEADPRPIFTSQVWRWPEQRWQHASCNFSKKSLCKTHLNLPVKEERLLYKRR